MASRIPIIVSGGASSNVPQTQRLIVACLRPQCQDRVSERAKKALDQVAKFVEEECIPYVDPYTNIHRAPLRADTRGRADPVLEAQLGPGDGRWDRYPSIIDELKQKARALGLWNMFLPKGHYKESPGFTNLEYGLMAEWLGKSKCASEAVNCAAPDTGNMEVLAKYGNDAQKAQWLKPLMEGEIRSAFLMTEPQVASSDATNIELSIRKEGDEYVLNGQVSHLTRSVSVLSRPGANESHRNGGPVAQVIQGARSTSSWASRILTTRTSIASSLLCWCLQMRRASPSTGC